MDEHKLIDELVHCAEPERIIELVKLLVPEANDRTAELYARWTEYEPDGFADYVMDNPSKFGRMKLIAKNFPYHDRAELVEIFRQLPYVPLTDEQRLYRLRRLRDDAPVPPENKYLAGEKFSTEEWETMPLDLYYAIRAMRYNPDLDPKSAARLVVAEMKKPPVDFSEDTDEKTSQPLSNEYALHFMMETKYLERIKFFYIAHGYEENRASDDAYFSLLNNVRSIADPNYEIKTLILVDANIASLHRAAAKNS